MQLTGLVYQVRVHSSVTDFATMLGTQQQRFGLFIGLHIHRLVTRDQVHGLFTALFRRQCITGTAEEYPGTGGANHHRATTIRAWNIGFGRRIFPHATLAGFSGGELLPKPRVKIIQHAAPIFLTLGDFVQRLFHIGGKTKVHQVGKTFHQALGDHIAHFLGIKTALVQAHIATILDRRNNRRIGRGTTDTAFLQLFDQARFGIARWRLGKVLAGIQLIEIEHRSLLNIGQYAIILLLAHRLQHLHKAVKANNATASAQFIVPCGNTERGAGKLCWRHLAGEKLAPDQFVQALGIALHRAQRCGTVPHIRRPDSLVRFLRALLTTIDIGRLG